MKYNEFLNHYSIEMLSSIDEHVHDFMLNKFISKQK